ncbi:YccF domain-containing protein [Tessaracoccus terricola]
MRTILNVIWLIFGGIWLAALYFIAGIVACIFIITIPFGIASFRMARYVLWPFGKAVVQRPDAGVMSGIGNVIWFIVAGWWLALAHIATAVAQAVTIIGIIDAVVNLKMIPVTCFPFGKRIVDRDSLHPGQRPLHSI